VIEALTVAAAATIRLLESIAALFSVPVPAQSFAPMRALITPSSAGMVRPAGVPYQAAHERSDPGKGSRRVAE